MCDYYNPTFSHAMKFQVRFTWESLDGKPHPKFSYQPAETESRAIDVAVAAVDRMKGNQHLRLVEVHWRHISSSNWRLVE
jgi:hypothetical protein